jgi:hypothetical protein
VVFLLVFAVSLVYVKLIGTSLLGRKDATA